MVRSTLHLLFVLLTTSQVLLADSRATPGVETDKNKFHAERGGAIQGGNNGVITVGGKHRGEEGINRGEGFDYLASINQFKNKTLNLFNTYEETMREENTQDWTTIKDGPVDKIKLKVADLLGKKPEDFKIVGNKEGALFPPKGKIGERSMLIITKDEILLLKESGKLDIIDRKKNGQVNAPLVPFFLVDGKPFILHTDSKENQVAWVDGKIWKIEQNRNANIRSAPFFLLTNPDSGQTTGVSYDFNGKKLSVTRDNKEIKATIAPPWKSLIQPN